MNRRAFIRLLGSAAAWPLVARAQQPGMPRIGFLSVFAESDPEGQAWIRELMQRLQQLGWVNGRNVRIDFRFGGADAARISTLATELIELRPDMILLLPRTLPLRCGSRLFPYPSYSCRLLIRSARAS
jgi:putative tryptophan/tyrosine transport system substrate-binding protein